MKKHLQTAVTTLVVGFGVWFGLFITTTIHGLLGEASPALYQMLSLGSQIAGAAAGIFWAIRRSRKRPVTFSEYALIFFSAISLTYLGYLYLH